MHYSKQELYDLIEKEPLNVSLKALIVTGQFYNLNSLVAWAKKELEGYGNDKVPDYRYTISKFRYKKDDQILEIDKNLNTYLTDGILQLEEKVKHKEYLIPKIGKKFFFYNVYLFFYKIQKRITAMGSEEEGIPMFLFLGFLVTFIGSTIFAVININDEEYIRGISIYLGVLGLMCLIGIFPPYYSLSLIVQKEQITIINELIKTEAKRQIELHFPKDLEVYSSPDFDKLVDEIELSSILQKRWHEANSNFHVGSYLSTVILLGSILEGILLHFIEKFPKEANKCSSAPKDSKNGANKKFSDWTFQELIAVSHEIGFIDKEVKDFSSALREYRNLIHPNLQRNRKIEPDFHTCKVSWEVVNSAIFDLSKYLRMKKSSA